MPPLGRILRGSLVATPGPAGPVGSFTLPCRKLILEYNESWPSSRGTKIFVEEQAVQVAKRFPSVEVVALEKPNHHPLARGLYTNDREKVISLRNMDPISVAEKVLLLLESSGKKLTNLKRKSVVPGSPESARGMWSPLHGPRK